VRVSALCPGATETPILDSTGPADLAPHEGVSARHLLTKASGGQIYPVEKLAEDCVRGVRQNKALIVAPRRARITWRLNRLLPGQVEKAASRLAFWAKREAERVERAVSG
jgi:short-subunit dehydrogenase